jgi:hypothetical protein
MHKFDVTNTAFYRYDKPELNEVIKSRLTQMAELGMEVCGYGEFGIKGVMSDLYIEKVWNYTDEDFTAYMGWVESLLKRAEQSQTQSNPH